MKAAVVSLFSLLAGASAFLPVAPIGRNACGSTAPPTSSSSSHVVRAKPLSMGFDFKSAMEKMSDTRYARVRHILVDEKGEEGKAKLEEAKAEIDGDLDKFSEVAERMSTCTSASKGGRLKLLGRGETVPAFDDIAFNAEFGVVHGPVETEFGTHLIYVESCNKPENTWKKLYEDVVKKVSGKEDEK